MLIFRMLVLSFMLIVIYLICESHLTYITELKLLLRPFLFTVTAVYEFNSIFSDISMYYYFHFVSTL